MNLLTEGEGGHVKNWQNSVSVVVYGRPLHIFAPLLSRRLRILGKEKKWFTTQLYDPLYKVYTAFKKSFPFDLFIS